MPLTDEELRGVVLAVKDELGSEFRESIILAVKEDLRGEFREGIILAVKEALGAEFREVVSAIKDELTLFNVTMTALVHDAENHEENFKDCKKVHGKDSEDLWRKLNLKETDITTLKETVAGLQAKICAMEKAADRESKKTQNKEGKEDKKWHEGYLEIAKYLAVAGTGGGVSEGLQRLFGGS